MLYNFFALLISWPNNRNNSNKYFRVKGNIFLANKNTKIAFSPLLFGIVMDLFHSKHRDIGKKLDLVYSGDDVNTISCRH